MAILNFITQYWDSILLVLIVIAGLVILWYKGQKKIVYKILYTLVTEAEKTFGGGTGTLKQSTVIMQVYEKLPEVFRAFVTLPTLVKWLEEVLKKAKAEWAEKGELGNYIQSK